MSESSTFSEPEQRYPDEVAYLRHAESRYNARHHQSRELHSQRVFTTQFSEEYFVNGDPAKGPKDDLDLLYYERKWPSDKLKALALAYFRDMRLVMDRVSDADTPLTEEGHHQAEQVGTRLPEVIKRPDIIYVSPYLRTRQTLAGVLRTAPNDWSKITKWENEDLREQEYGIQTVHSDWRLTFVFHPEEMVRYLHEGPYSFRPLGGESKHNVRGRGSKFIGRLHRKHVGENVLAVTHHLAILANLAEILHWSREQFMDWDEKRRPPNCSVTVLNRAEGASRTGRDQLIFDESKYGMKLYE